MPEPLIVGVDINVLKRNQTGVKTYLEEVIREFKAGGDSDVIYRFLDSPISVYKTNSSFFKLLNHINFHFWKQVMLPLRAFFHGCDIVFCVDDCVPVLHLRYQTVHVIHDAFCFEMPENYGKLWLKFYKATLIAGAKRARFIIAPTNYSKGKISQYIGLDPEKIIVIPEAPKRVQKNKSFDGRNVIEQFKLQNSKYILHVGSMFKRKNIPVLVNAFAKIKNNVNEDFKLVLAGSFITNAADNDYEAVTTAINTNGLENDVLITGYLTDEQIAALYANAAMYVFPSVNEGFGLPILEAFENGLPVLVADNTCLPEVGGNAVLKFDPYNVEQLANTILMILDNPGLKQDMINKGHERLKQFSWRKTASEIIDVFKKVN